MRIALISGTFLPVVGGVEWKVHYLASEYIKRGHEATVFTTRPEVTFKPIPLPVHAEYEVVRCGIPLPGMGRLGVTEWLMRRAVLKHHARRPWDVLHCHHLGFPTRVGLGVKRRTGLPVVATTCGQDVQTVPELGYGDRLDPRLDRLARQNVRGVDIVGSISSAVRADLESLGTTARIVDIPNGVPWDEFQGGPSTWLRDRLGLDAQGVLVLSVGRNHVKKGYEGGLRAFARVPARFKDAHYVLVGRNTSALEPVVRELALQGRVHLMEQVPFKDIPQVFHSADVFFNPSLVEGFAQVNAQALACGLPCVLTDAPGNRDAGDHGGALVAKAGDVGSMAEALADLIADPARRRRLGQEAHRASMRYAWRQIADEYLAAFEGLLGSRGKGVAAGGQG